MPKRLLFPTVRFTIPSFLSENWQIPPRLFTVPEKQQVVPNLRPPEARSDLVDLMRVVVR